MSFEENLRAKITGFPYGSPERNLMKLVLGDFQQGVAKAPTGTISDEAAHAIVKKIIQGNTDSLGYLPAGDSRRDQYIRENELLTELLPQYWTAAQIRQSLEEAGVDVKSTDPHLTTEANEGKATGKAMKHLKSINAPIEGQTVKDVVMEMRK